MGRVQRSGTAGRVYLHPHRSTNDAGLGYGRQNPYCSGVVELQEGGRVVALIDEVEPTRPEEIMVGMPLTVKYLHQGEGESAQTMLAFKPTSSCDPGLT